MSIPPVNSTPFPIITSDNMSENGLTAIVKVALEALAGETPSEPTDSSDFDGLVDYTFKTIWFSEMEAVFKPLDTAVKARFTSLFEQYQQKEEIEEKNDTLKEIHQLANAHHINTSLIIDSCTKKTEEFCKSLEALLNNIDELNKIEIKKKHSEQCLKFAENQLRAHIEFCFNFHMNSIGSPFSRGPSESEKKIHAIQVDYSHKKCTPNMTIFEAELFLSEFEDYDDISIIKEKEEYKALLEKSRAELDVLSKEEAAAIWAINNPPKQPESPKKKEATTSHLDPLLSKSTKELETVLELQTLLEETLNQHSSKRQKSKCALL